MMQFRDCWTKGLLNKRRTSVCGGDFRRCIEGLPVLDLDYDEDSQCDTDMNVVMTESGEFIEVQSTAEGVAFSRATMNHLLDLAEDGIADLIALQKQALGLGA
jgi:ribonuclease PH